MTLLTKHAVTSRSVLRFICHSISPKSPVKYRGIRPCLKMTKIDPKTPAGQSFQAVVDVPEFKFLTNLFQCAGHEIRIAGGAVRDLLYGGIPHDVDLATTATPPQMIELLSDKDNVRLITTKAGEKHGTVAARINDKNQYEITTLRIDTKTDGRHAEVQFTTDWELDASRRDLTINSMFLGIDGTLYDYFNGAEDLREGRIRFVGSPEDRIKEDYLRIFRYFRFFARYGRSGNHEEETLKAMRENVDGLKIISGERIWAETKRILIIPNCKEVVHVMLNDVGIAPYMGFQALNENSQLDLSEFDRVHDCLLNLEIPYPPEVLLSSLFKDDEEVIKVTLRIRLSNIERDTARFIVANRDESIGLRELRIKLGLEEKSQQDHMRRLMINYALYMGKPDLMKEIEVWRIPDFPLKGQVIGEKVKKRRLIGQLIDELRKYWAKNDFKSTEEDLRHHLDILLSTKYKDEKV